MPKKLKGKHIYELSSPYIREMFIHDLRSSICKYNKRFSDVFHKSEELVLMQQITPEMLEELLWHCQNRIEQAEFIKSEVKIGYMGFDENMVIRYYSVLSRKIKELLDEKKI